jgi:Cu-processing system permease protein
MKAFWLCARQELVLAARSRFLLVFAVTFAVLALLVAASGYVLTGGAGIQDFNRTAASLIELVVLVVPLAALVMGVTALTQDRGALELLFSQPFARSTILAGRLAGLLGALAAAEAIGFGLSGLVLFSRSGGMGVGAFLGVAASSVVLTAVFLGLAAALTAGGAARRRLRALSLALVVWFVAVVLVDVAALAVASQLSSRLASRVLIATTIVNPIDAVRTSMLLLVQGTAAFGAASLAFLRVTHGATGAAVWLGASILVWIVAPLTIGAVRLNRADI